jgi:toxin ParE1/3/4
MILRYTSPALREVDEAFAWYEARNPDAAYRFMDALDQTAKRISRYPYVSPANADGVRRAFCTGFPYALCYLIENDEIVVHAVNHTRRHPDYFTDRLA